MKLSHAIAAAFAVAILNSACGASSSPPASAAAPTTAPAAAPASAPTGAPPGGYVTDDLTKVVNILLRSPRNFDNGEKVFKSIACTLCHHFGEGADGIGPDLTGVGGRAGTREILQSILEPSHDISDLYGTKAVTLLDGTKIIGRVEGVGDTDNVIGVQETFTLDPATMAYTWTNKPTLVSRANIDSIEDSHVSPMPPGLINSKTTEEIADLIAYLRSGGDREANFFKPQPAAAPATPPAPAAPAKK